MTDQEYDEIGELQEEIALWKRATGYDDPEHLDSFLGRAGVLNQFDVLNKMLADANKEKQQLRELLTKAQPLLPDHPKRYVWEKCSCALCDLKSHITAILLKNKR
jgi:hypothetical protein